MSSTHHILAKMHAGLKKSSSVTDDKIENETNVHVSSPTPGVSPKQSMDEILKQALNMKKPAPKPQSR